MGGGERGKVRGRWGEGRGVKSGVNGGRSVRSEGVSDRLRSVQCVWAVKIGDIYMVCAGTWSKGVCGVLYSEECLQL